MASEPTPSVDEILAAVTSALEDCAGALWFSGYAGGELSLLGSAGLVEEVLGAGHVVLFSGEPNFRGWTDGTQVLLANALVYPKEAAAFAGVDVRSPRAARAVARAQALAQASDEPAIGPGRPKKTASTIESTNQKSVAMPTPTRVMFQRLTPLPAITQW